MTSTTASRRLARIPSQGRIAGVCAGIGEYLDVDVTLVRFAWVILAIVPGCVVGGILAYLAAWIVMPESEGPALMESRLTRSMNDRKVAGVCGGIAEYLALDPTVVRLVWVVLTILPGAIVLGVAAYVVAWFIIPEPPLLKVVHVPSDP